MNTGKRLGRTALCKRLIAQHDLLRTRAASFTRCELVTFSYPASRTLRRAYHWQSAPPATLDLTRVAFHEAGHVALHVLHARRARVQEIAAHLVAYGSWQSESPVPPISNRKKEPLHG